MEKIIAKTITIKDIELHTQRPRTLQHVRAARQFYAEFFVGYTCRSTDSAKEENHYTSWDEQLGFDGDDYSVLFVQVYQKHHVRYANLVGGLSDTIGGVLGKLKDGVLEVTLGKDTSDHLGIAIKFALVAEPRRGDVSEDKPGLATAIIGATKTFGAVGSTPVVVDLLSSAVELQIFQPTWCLLLKRMELFNNIVTNITQIHPYTALAWSAISAATQMLIDQKNRDERIIRLAGTMSDVFAFVEDAEPLQRIMAHMKIITLLIQQVTECGRFITEYVKQKNFWIRTAKYTMSDIDARITDHENKLRELKIAFLEGVAVHTGITVDRIMHMVERIAEALDLHDVSYEFGAGYVQEKGCLAGTCESFLGDIQVCGTH